MKIQICKFCNYPNTCVVEFKILSIPFRHHTKEFQSFVNPFYNLSLPIQLIVIKFFGLKQWSSFFFSIGTISLFGSPMYPKSARAVWPSFNCWIKPSLAMVISETTPLYPELIQIILCGKSNETATSVFKAWNLSLKEKYSQGSRDGAGICVRVTSTTQTLPMAWEWQ